jgi:hypothetical protein
LSPFLLFLNILCREWGYHLSPFVAVMSLVRYILFFCTGSTLPWALISDFFQLHNHFTDDRTPWTSDHLVARPLPKHRTTQTQNKHIHIRNTHALCGIRTHEPGFRASEDSTCFRPLDYLDRPGINYGTKLWTHSKYISTLYYDKFLIFLLIPFHLFNSNSALFPSYIFAVRETVI